MMGLLLALLLLATPAHAATMIQCDGKTDVTQAILTAAQATTEIHLAGTCPVTQLVFRTPVSLIGEGAPGEASGSPLTITGTHLVSSVSGILWYTGEGNRWSRVEHLGIVGTGGGSQIGILVENQGLYLDDVVVAGAGFGMVVTNGVMLSCRRCQFVFNTWDGVFVNSENASESSNFMAFQDSSFSKNGRDGLRLFSGGRGLTCDHCNFDTNGNWQFFDYAGLQPSDHVRLRSIWVECSIPPVGGSLYLGGNDVRVDLLHNTCGRVLSNGTGNVWNSP